MGRHSVSRSFAVGVAIWVVVSGCAGESSQPEATPESLNTSAPITDTEGPSPDAGGDGGTAVLLPKIPIGGNADVSADPGHPANQCVSINWIVDNEAAQIPASVQVRLTGVTFDPPIFAVTEAGCSGSTPPCGGYVFTTGNQACDIAIEPLGISADPSGGSPSMSATGEVLCDDAESPECTTFLEAVATEQNVAIDLNFPELSETTVSESPPGPAESTDTMATTDEGDSGS